MLPLQTSKFNLSFLSKELRFCTVAIAMNHLALRPTPFTMSGLSSMLSQQMALKLMHRKISIVLTNLEIN